MDMLRKVTFAAASLSFALTATGAHPAACSKTDYAAAFGKTKICESGQLKMSCDGAYPDVEPGKALCCELTSTSSSWYCDGEEHAFKCPAGSVRVQAVAVTGGVKLTCFAPKSDLEPEDAEDDTD